MSEDFENKMLEALADITERLKRIEEQVKTTDRRFAEALKATREGIARNQEALR